MRPTPELGRFHSSVNSPYTSRRASADDQIPTDDSVSPRRSHTYPGTPYHSASGSIRSPQLLPIRRNVGPPDDTFTPDLESIVRDALPTPRRPPASPSAGGLSDAARAAERFASDLSNQLDSSASRSQQLLNEIYKLKLQKAQQKIDALQEQLADIGHRDAQLERELRREQDELKDWEIAKLDDGIMQDLGKLTEAEYARLKRGMFERFLSRV